MILFHGSNIEINDIQLEKCRPYKDFGKGFYLTTIEDQAIIMAKRISRIYGGSPCVTIFDFKRDRISDKELAVKTFDNPSAEWALFVLNNRNRSYLDFSDANCNHDNKYDIVIGSVANDDIALLFRTFSSGLIDVNTLVNEMKYKNLTDQYSFHTPKAISYLIKVGAKSYE